MGNHVFIYNGKNSFPFFSLDKIEIHTEITQYKFCHVYGFVRLCAAATTTKNTHTHTPSAYCTNDKTSSVTCLATA